MEVLSSQSSDEGSRDAQFIDFVPLPDAMGHATTRWDMQRHDGTCNDTLGHATKGCEETIDCEKFQIKKQMEKEVRHRDLRDGADQGWEYRWRKVPDRECDGRDRKGRVRDAEAKNCEIERISNV